MDFQHYLIGNNHAKIAKNFNYTQIFPPKQPDSYCAMRALSLLPRICALQCTPGWFLKRSRCISRAAITLARISLPGSPGARLAMSSNSTGSISIWMSIFQGISRSRFLSKYLFSVMITYGKHFDFNHILNHSVDYAMLRVDTARPVSRKFIFESLRLADSNIRMLGHIFEQQVYFI